MSDQPLFGTLVCAARRVSARWIAHGVRLGAAWCARCAATTQAALQFVVGRDTRSQGAWIEQGWRAAPAEGATVTMPA